MHRYLSSIPILVAVAACGEDRTERATTAQSADECEAMYRAVCERACDCTGDACLAFGSVSASYSTSFERCIEDVPEDCAEDRLPGRDFRGCVAELEASECSTVPDSNMQGLELPDVCSYALCLGMTVGDEPVLCGPPNE